MSPPTTGVFANPATGFPAPFWLSPAGSGEVDDLLFQIAFDLHPTRPGRVRLALRGELDVATVPELAAGLSMLLDCLLHLPAGAHLLAYLDLSELTFLDCGGLSGLLAAKDALSQAGWRVHLVGVDGEVLRLLSFAAQQGWLAAPTCRSAIADPVRRLRQPAKTCDWLGSGVGSDRADGCQLACCFLDADVTHAAVMGAVPAAAGDAIQAASRS
jgi:anti-anti-sigma factor